MKKPRLRINQVYFEVDQKAKTQRAMVALSMGWQKFLGIQQGELDAPKPALIAMATFEATNKALEMLTGITAKFDLKVADQIEPNFMEKSLFVVIVEASADNLCIKGTGAVIASKEEGCRAVAAASMDAINRFIAQFFKDNDITPVVD